MSRVSACANAYSPSSSSVTRPAARSLVLQVQQTARVDFALEIGQVTESVEVSAVATQLNTDDATVGTVIEQKRITDLPINGRNFLQLVRLFERRSLPHSCR